MAAAVNAHGKAPAHPGLFPKFTERGTRGSLIDCSRRCTQHVQEVESAAEQHAATPSDAHGTECA